MELRILQPKEDKTDPIFQSPDCQSLLQMYDEYYLKIGFNVPWVAYMVIHENKALGSCSFTGKPVDGKVEIAYWTFTGFEGKGIASFACKELIKIAENTDPKIIVIAKTAPEQNASTKILQKNNFIFTGSVQDEDIGDAWLWTLDAHIKK